MSTTQAPDPKLAKTIAQNLAALGDDLGTRVKVLHEGEPQPVVRSSATEQERRDAKAVGMREEGVARAKAAQEAGLPFAGRYLQAGFMMAGASNPTRREEQVAQVKAASPAELQDVLAVNVRRNVELGQRECALRFAQYLRNTPAKAAEIASAGEGKPPAESRAEVDKARLKARQSFGYREYDWQRRASMRLVAEPGKEPRQEHTQLPDADGRILMSIRRGYTAIADELLSRGLQPALSMYGKGTQERTKQRDQKAAEANAEAPKAKRMVRGGMEL